MHRGSLAGRTSGTRGFSVHEQLSLSRSTLTPSLRPHQPHLRLSFLHHPHLRHSPTVPQAAGRRGGSARGSNPGGLDPALEREVPPEQRPVNELKALRKTSLYSWVSFRFSCHSAPSLLSLELDKWRLPRGPQSSSTRSILLALTVWEGNTLALSRIVFTASITPCDHIKCNLVFKLRKQWQVALLARDASDVVPTLLA